MRGQQEVKRRPWEQRADVRHALQRTRDRVGRTATRSSSEELAVVARVLGRHHCAVTRSSTRDRKMPKRLALDFSADGRFGASTAGHQSTDLSCVRPTHRKHSRSNPTTATKFSTGTGTGNIGSEYGTAVQQYSRTNTRSNNTRTRTNTRSTSSQGDSIIDSTSPPHHVEKAVLVRTDKYDSGEETGEFTDVTNEHRSSSEETSPTHRYAKERSFLSVGDPKQFLIVGSIGDRRVRILVDTGATISFVKSTLVPLLTPQPKVEKSELAVVFERVWHTRETRLG